MKRSNSLQNCQRKNSATPFLIRCISKSLPNIGILTEECVKKPGEVKRQNSRKVKILQKTWDKVKTIIHPSGRRNSRTKQTPSELSESPRTSSPLLAKYLKSTQSSCSAPSTPSKKLVFDFEPIVTAPLLRTHVSQGYHDTQLQEPEEVDQVVKNFVELQKRLSDELHQAIKEDKRKDEGLSEDFKKRLQQWEMWKVSTGKYHYTEEELQKLLPLEFSKKLQEWEDIKSRPREEGLHSTPEVFHTTPSKTVLKNDRKNKKKIDESQRQKELAWLEKQLEKIEGEKKRLEREMVKYCQREVRLQKMREALQNNPNPKQDVWIKTPTAECKVEGINEKFTKKIYKWEEKKGIEPESSTMAFLNPKYYFPSTSEQLTADPEVQTPVTKNDEDSYYEDEVGNPPQENKDYSSQSEDSEADEEYEEATDSFATKDEPASGTSNTDSDCFNLKPGYRRRSSDAISTPLSARSPSPSCCTSDDEENFMLQTVNENEEEKLDEKPPIVKAKPFVVQEDETPEASSVIVKTQRTIFTPVETDDGVETAGAEKIENTFTEGTSLTAPRLVKNIAQKLSHDESNTNTSKSQFGNCKSIYGISWEKNDTEPPKVVGVTRKLSNASSNYNFDLPPIPSLHKTSIKDGTKPIILGKIPVWCSPLITRRRFLDAQSSVEKFTTTPQYDFSLDTFLQTNAIPIPPPRPSRIPVTASPGCSRRKYTLSRGSSLADEHLQAVRLVSLTRSTSFQGNRTASSGATTSTGFTSHAIDVHPVQLKEQSQPFVGQGELSYLQSSVTKSKSTGSILGNSGTRGLFGFASKFVHNKSEPKQKRQILPSWLKTPSGAN